MPWRKGILFVLIIKVKIGDLIKKLAQEQEEKEKLLKEREQYEEKIDYLLKEKYYNEKF